MNSANYRVETDVISVGGGHALSGSYAGDDTLNDQATGENLLSASYRACAGYECFEGTPYISFNVTAGLTAPGVAGDPVNLGTIPLTSVKGSDHATVNSAFITAESTARGGAVVRVVDEFGALKRTGGAAQIPSVTATLVGGTAGYGVCVASSTQHADSWTSFLPVAPYDGTCDVTSGHDVGALSTTAQPILQSSGPLKGGQAEVLVKAAVSGTIEGASDYADTITFTMTATY